MDADVLSWIFTESLIQKCFDICLKTVDKKVRRTISLFVNQMCSVNVGDVSSAEGQCECLVGAVTVCFIMLFFIG